MSRIEYERLQSMIEAVQSGKRLSKALRAEIVDALDLLYIMQLGDERAHSKGRRRSTLTWHFAAIVRELIESRQAKLKDAISAAAPAASMKARETIKTAYYKLKKGSVSGLKLSNATVEEAAARLPPRKRRNK